MFYWLSRVAARLSNRVALRLSAQKHFRGVLRNRQWFRRFWIGVELAKDRRILAEMFFQRINAIRIAWMVRQELRHLTHIGILKVLKQPYQSPWVVSGCRAHV